jgi:hypothetical protein
MPLDNIDEFMRALTLPASDVTNMAYLKVGLTEGQLGHIGTLYCPHCSEYSGMKLKTLHFEHTVGEQIFRELTREDTIGGSARATLQPRFDPSLFRLDCVNCDNAFYCLMYRSQDGPCLASFSIRGGGLATPNTSDEVRYYLEQAYKAQAASAYSAALAMYRAGLERLLEDKQLKGSLHAKLEKLSEGITSGTAASWARRLDVSALTIIKEICNCHVHPGELCKLQALTPQFMSGVQRTFSNLLSLAYEQDPRQAAAKAKLQAVLAKGKSKSQKNTNFKLEH